jgi:hypothetical protein
MRKLNRPIVLAVVAGLLTPAWAVSAATQRGETTIKPICKLIKDPKGDANSIGTNGAKTPQSDPNMDILSADFATNATTLTGVVRLAGLSSDDNMAPTGRSYQWTFQVDERSTIIDVVVSKAGVTWYGGKGRGVVDYKKKQIRMSVPLTKLEVRIRPGTVLRYNGALTRRVALTSAVDFGIVDRAATSKSFVAGSPTCVKVGA